MKPQLLKILDQPSCSVNVRQDRVPSINNCWHYHAEVELIYFKQGQGTQFIGDNIKLFHSGDVILVGAHLPHYWSFDDKYFNTETEDINVFVSHFSEKFWGKDFLNLPENFTLKNIFETAKRRIELIGETREYVGKLLEEMFVSIGHRKIFLLWEALITIADSNNFRILSSIGFQPNLKETENGCINSIYKFSLANYKRKINLHEVAAIACMSPNSFCRFFRSKTGKTYSNFLAEIKVGMACKLLILNKLTLKRICYESGFSNFSSFHKYFKLITNKTPLKYQKEFFLKNN